ncbi:GNAT family N-acetyltransferase [Paenibacillus lycopersici]|uniref:GNAT family N-acetyltransferase n=1 Tax=Paenibacillus lycopersici TaxID=2704462 RepID=A0A6C0FPR4_9BACL|nr:GNAT family N-acetyltransferase [Paenibacillus lycopersici]QHT59126.1 GNAT family N-acetyltransferase [Paenibacillus lycopersici]
MIYPERTTPRLRLRELTLADAEAACRHFADPEVTRFMDIEPCGSIREAEAIIQFHLDDSGCRYGMFDKETAALLGTCGFHCWRQDPAGIAEIGFDLSPSCWGQGYMAEALRELIDIGFRQMKLAVIEATVEVDNTRCQSLLAKLGFTRATALRDGLYYYALARPA